MIETVELIVRPAVVADLEPMAAIRRRPQVQANQYWLVEAFWLDYAESVILAQQSGTTYYYVLEVSGSVVGFVTIQSLMRKEVQYGYFSFNLLPEFWGQGHMEKAVRTIFGEFFLNEDNQGAMAECFSGNRQCQRLLSKLSFVSVPTPISERLSMWISCRPLRWVKRFWLSKESWSRLD